MKTAEPSKLFLACILLSVIGAIAGMEMAFIEQDWWWVSACLPAFILLSPW